MTGIVILGSTMRRMVQLSRFSTGEKYDATGSPSIEFWVNGSAVQTLSMSKVGANTGLYQNANVSGGFSVANGFAVGDLVEVRVTATVDGVAASDIIDRFTIYNAQWATGNQDVILAPSGLDFITDTESLPGDVNNFRERLRALCSKFQNKRSKNKTTGAVTIRNVADSGNLISHSVTDDGTSINVAADANP